MSDQIIEDVLNTWAARQGIALGDMPHQVRFEVKERLLDAYLTLRPVIRAHGGVMPEDLPEVKMLEGEYLVHPADSSLPVTMISGDNVTLGDIKRWQAKGMAYLAIAKRAEENQS